MHTGLYASRRRCLQAYLFMFFGVSLIYTDLLETQSVVQPSPIDAATTPEGAPPSPIRGAAAAAAMSRPSRSPFAVLIFAAAALMTVGLVCGFVVTMTPVVVGLVHDVSAAAVMRLEVLPWVLVAVLMVFLYRRERKARLAADNLTESLRQSELDKERVASYPAKSVPACTLQ